MATHRGDYLRQFLTIAALVLTLVVNTLAATVGINGRLTGAISDEFPVYFTPAGYVFSIWGVIYVGLIVYAVFQALPRQRANPLLRRIAPWFIAGCLANTGWILLWHYDQIPASLALMVLLLFSLIVIYLILDTGRVPAPSRQRWFVQLPFSIYLGWITVATVANATVVLYDLSWNGWGLAEELWAVIVIGAAALIAGVLSLRHGDIAYVAVIVWSLVGIIVGQGARSLPVAIMAGAMAVIVVLTLLVSVPNRRRRLLGSVHIHPGA